jgi:hypothetical protein
MSFGLVSRSLGFPSPAPTQRPRSDMRCPAWALFALPRQGAGPLAGHLRSAGFGCRAVSCRRRAGPGGRAAARPSRLRSAGRRCWNYERGTQPAVQLSGPDPARERWRPLPTRRA